MTYDNDLINTVLYEYYNTDIIITDLAKKYHVSPKSIYNWRKKVNENDYIGKDIKSARKNEICHERKEYKCKLTTEIRQYIDNCINKNKIIDTSKFLKHIRKTFKINLCRSTLYKWFDKMNITYKKINVKKTYITKQKEKKLKELHDKIDKVENKNLIISLDECHFETNKCQHKGWNHKGKKLYRKTYSKIRKGVSLLMAISKEKVIGYEISEKAFNGQTFTDFIKSIDNNNNTYLMDNARIHHSKIFKQYMGTQTSKIIYNVPYNPETNPIEHVFSSLKNNVIKLNTRTLSELKKSIKKSIKKIKKSHLENYFRYSLNI